MGLITDKVQKILLELLEKEGIKFDYLPDIEKDDLIRIIGNYDFIIVRSRTKINKEILDKAVNLKVIIRYGVGLDNIDVNYAKEKGIRVFNTPRAFTEAVAELTLAMMLGLLRGVGEAHCGMKMGKWEKKRFFGPELMNKTVAILGFGRIGRRVADLLTPFNVKIIAYDIANIPEEYVEKGVIAAESIEEAIVNADIITLHMPLTKDTHNLINMDLIKKMKRKPFIINTARGAIVNIDDVKKAIKEGIIRGIALDVYPEEPPKDEELRNLSNVLMTPHIGAQTYEAYERAAYEVINILKENLMG